MAPRNIILSIPWWLRAVLSVVLLVLITGGTLVVGKVIRLEAENIWLAFGCIAAVVVLASLSGALVALLASGERISVAEQEVEEKLKVLSRETNELKTACSSLSHLPKECQKCTESLGRAISSAKEIANMALERFGRSIITYHDLKDIENSVAENGHIWILTSALELEDSELKDTVRSNFKKNISYIYLIPKEDKYLQERFVRLAKQWKSDCGLSTESAKKQIRCLLVPKHFVYMTVIIYEPYAKQPTVLVKFPTSKIYEKKKYPLIYRVDTDPKEAWRSFLDSFQDLIHEESPCSHTEPLVIDFE